MYKMKKKYYYISVILLLLSGISYSQTESKNTVDATQDWPKKLLFGTIQLQSADSGMILTYYTKGHCKNYFLTNKFIPYPQEIAISEKKNVPEKRKVKFLTVHGNIYYDFFYRSKMEMPLNQEDFRQHTERVYLDVMLQEKYPLKVSLMSRQSNSLFFRNFFDVNLSFDKYAYTKNIKQDLISKLEAQLPQQPDLKIAEAALIEQTRRYLGLKKWLESSATLQKIIEERERLYSKKLTQKQYSSDVPGLPAIPSLDILKKPTIVKDLASKADSTKETFTQLYEKRKEEFAVLSVKLNSLKNKKDSIKNVLQKKLLVDKQKIYKATTEKELSKIAADRGIKEYKKAKLESQLNAIKSFAVGRSMLDYTELTAQNIIVSGLNIEYNPSYYAAFAIGKIDYRYRDFFNKNANNNGQYIALGRIGLGDKDKKALIFTLFKGRKNSTEYALSDSVTGNVNIVGYSLEAIYKKDKNTSFSVEIAKSTKPVTGGLGSGKQVNALWKFADQSNTGISIKAETIIPETKTKFNGFFRKTGESFQSFSLFSYNSNQVAWLAQADQSLFRNKIHITGALRQNDFTNPFTDKSFKTTTTFKSLMLSINYPKYPSFSLGYYPGTQLYVVDKERIRENAYYILTASSVFSYFYKETGMTSSVVYNRYFNQATDSGFVLYKGINWYASQTLMYKKLQIQGGYAYNKQPGLGFYTLEVSGDYAIKSFLKAGAGLKYNKVSSGYNYWGERMQLSVDFKQLGGLQFQYEKSYLPTITQTLYPVEIGRVSWYKIF